MTRRAAVWVGAVLVLAAGGAGAARAADDVTGDWKWEMRGRQGGGGEARQVILKLKQDGEKVTGTLGVVGSDREPVEIREGSIKGGEITFEVSREFNNQTFTQKYKGKVDGDAIRGTVESAGRDGQTRSRDWEAKRASSDKA